MKTLCWTAGSLCLLITATLVIGCGSITNNSIPAQSSNGSSGAGSGSGSGNTSGAGTAGTGTGSSGNGSTGSGASGSSSAGSSGSGTTGTGTGSGGSGSTGSSGNGSGSGTTGTGAGSGGTGSGSTGSGADGSGSSGSGSSGSGSGSGSPGTGIAGGALALVPVNAVHVDAIQALNNWRADYDTGTSGSSGGATGASSLVETPSMSGSARAYASDYTYYGGERFYASFGADTLAKHFLYDVWVYLDRSVSQVANIEMDMNQTMPNGQTVIFGFQCDGWSNTWDYTTNAGTPDNYVDRWLKSDQACNVQDWSQNTWHHVQVMYSRDDVGNVTYQSVWLDDVEQDINATTPSAFTLGWGPTLLTNLQIDGRNSTTGSSTVYLDNLTVYRW